MDSTLWDAIEKVERQHWWFRGRRELVTSVVRERLPVGAKVLDVGCGTGFVLERLLEVFDAWGVEPDVSVRERATQFAKPRILSGSTEDLSLVEANSFDAVLLLDVLEHVAHDTEALRSAATLLRPGGSVLITVPAFPFLWSSHDVRNQHRRRYTRASLRSTIRDAGLRPTLLTFVNARLFPLAMAHRIVLTAFGRRTDRELDLPPRYINDLFMRIFSGEAQQASRGYPFGLSLIAWASPSD